MKFRLHQSMVSSDGVTFSTAACLPSKLQCTTTLNLDSIVKIYKDNGWSMIPMLSHDLNVATITATDIDKYVKFVDWFVSKYKADAGIKYLELINAPVAWFKGTKEQLLQLTNKTYDTIKPKYPDLLIGTPGFEYSDNDPTKADPITLIEYFLDKTNGAKFDFWAFHGYPLMHITPNVGVTFYPPTQNPGIKNIYAGIPGILEIRRLLDANGWNDRLIIDTEHVGVTQMKKAGLTQASDKLDAAYMAQELLLKRTLRSADRFVLSGIVPFKMIPRGDTGEFQYGSLDPSGAATQSVQAAALLKAKIGQYDYVSRVSGTYDNDQQIWIEKFESTDKTRELYVFFKPFASGAAVSFDSKVLQYSLGLHKQPVSAVLTDLTGSQTSLAVSGTFLIGGENSIKFLEVQY